MEITHWFCSRFQMNKVLQQMNGEKGWRWGKGERRAVDVAVGTSDCKVSSPLLPYLCVSGGSPPLPPLLSFLCHFSPPSSHLLLHSLLQFFFHSFPQALYLFTSDVPAPFMPSDFGCPSVTLLFLNFISAPLTAWCVQQLYICSQGCSASL